MDTAIIYPSRLSRDKGAGNDDLRIYAAREAFDIPSFTAKSAEKKAPIRRMAMTD
jgi:hypothetical protein